MEYEETLVLVKPHAVAADWEMPILKRYAEASLKLGRMRRVLFTRAQAEEFYAEHKGRPFFEALIDSMTVGACTAATFYGKDAVKKVRDLNGATDPAKANPGTIRYDFRGKGGPENTVHGSDSVEAAKREAHIVFGSDIG